MRRHAALPEMGREIIEDCTRKMHDQTWAERCDTVERALKEVVEATGADTTTDPVSRQRSAGIMIAAILDKLDAPEVTDSAHAKLAAASTEFDHQLAACDWMIEQAMAITDPVPGIAGTLH